MSLPRINEGAAFGPKVLKVLSEAFDEAWVTVASEFTPDEYEKAREALAESLMATAREDSDDTKRLSNAAIRAMQMKYPLRFGRQPQAQGSKNGELESGQFRLQQIIAFGLSDIINRED